MDVPVCKNVCMNDECMNVCMHVCDLYTLSSNYSINSSSYVCVRLACMHALVSAMERAHVCMLYIIRAYLLRSGIYAVATFASVRQIGGWCGSVSSLRRIALHIYAHTRSRWCPTTKQFSDKQLLSVPHWNLNAHTINQSCRKQPDSHHGRSQRRVRHHVWRRGQPARQFEQPFRRCLRATR